MKVDDEEIRPIWLDRNSGKVKIIDQRKLPHRFEVVTLAGPEDVIRAIREMYVRGAPLIGATGAYGVYLAAREAAGTSSFDETFQSACNGIREARPTAVNLSWAVDRMVAALESAGTSSAKISLALEEAGRITEEEAENCRKIGEHGMPIIQEIARKKDGGTVNILTHCNAGWLACIEYGTATAPIYTAAERGVDIHVWVDETRPLNQGARLTAWELGKAGIRHTLITDNAGGHLMQHGMVDMVIVGTDRTTHTGDVANKIGTYLKALAAKDNGVPFYVALPGSTFDWQLTDGLGQIPIEERNPEEVRYVQGLEEGKTRSVLICPEESPAANYAFDVTPARLVTGFITERGVCGANREAILGLFPERNRGTSNAQRSTPNIQLKDGI
jgi:methylthioribose-1-phosphate isomerase